MKYIDAEKLKEYFKAKYKEYAEKAEKDCPLQYQYMADGLDDAEQCIDSLQQEQPDNEDVDKVAQELYEHLYELKRRNNVPTNLYDKQEIIDLWKAGIVYGRSHPKQEMPDKETILRICKLHKAWSIIAPWENVEDFVMTNWNSENIV